MSATTLVGRATLRLLPRVFWCVDFAAVQASLDGEARSFYVVSLECDDFAGAHPACSREFDEEALAQGEAGQDDDCLLEGEVALLVSLCRVAYARAPPGRGRGVRR
jgi:hypothetical protein